MNPPIAIISGSGRFPLYVAEEARRQGRGVVAFGMQGWVDPALAQLVDKYFEIPVGGLRQLLEQLKAQGISEAIMAGKVSKAVLLEGSAAFDAETRRVLGEAGSGSASGILTAIGKRLEEIGVALLDSSVFLQDRLCPAGTITSRSPSPAEKEDIALGQRIARRMAELDVGQTVVVKRGVVIAVEALEGTDAALRRAHALAGDGLVVIKMASPRQDRRFDLPVIGQDTMAVLSETGVSCLALEAGSTLLLERNLVVASADADNIAVVGIAADAISEGRARIEHPR